MEAFIAQCISWIGVRVSGPEHLCVPAGNAFAKQKVMVSSFFWGILSIGLFLLSLRGLRGAVKSFLIQSLKKHRSLPHPALLGFGLFFWGVGWGVMSSPILGLLWSVWLLPVSQAIFYWKRRREKKEREASALTFFYALRGLVQAGLSLPAALFRLSDAIHSPFGVALQKSLKRYERGESFFDCVIRVRDGHCDATASLLRLLVMAYRNGLAVAPLLEKITPLLEAEALSQKKQEALTRSILVQALVAFCLPWGVFLALGFCQPHLISFREKSSSFAVVVALALAWECLGVYLIWRASKFF